MQTNTFEKPRTLLQYPLNDRQHISCNYLVPVCVLCLVYILHFSADAVLSYQHYREGDPFHGVITLLLMYFPSVGSFFLTVIDLEIWPEEDGFKTTSLKWLAIRFFQHLCFPIWAMYRYAEQLFWTIEAIRSENKMEQEGLIKRAERNSIFELYHFLQAYLQAAPQILFQCYIITQHPSDFNKSTVDVQVMSIFMSLVKMAITTMSYQRFRSQKVAGRKYQWNKHKEQTVKIINETEMEEPNAERRNSNVSTTSTQFEVPIAHPKPNDITLPLQIVTIRGKTDDDNAGKLVSFIWWFCFILPRMLCLALFTHFYPTEAFWVCLAHYLIVLAFLIYDVKLTDVKYYCAFFVIFISYVYMFCLIEFKVTFRNIKRIYNCYFILVYLENFVIIYSWYAYIDTFNIWWYNYVFYVVIGSSVISVLSMAMYLSTLQPQKIIVDKSYRTSKL